MDHRYFEDQALAARNLAQRALAPAAMAARPWASFRARNKRHTMASSVLARWLASRKGAVNRVLILSRFLGHTNVEDTFWYLTAFPEVLAEAAQRFALNENKNC